MLIRNDSVYLADIFAKFDELNLSLQGNKINIVKVKSVLSGFNNKLTLYQRNLAKGDFFQFARLQQLGLHRQRRSSRPPNPPIGGGPGQLWGPKLV